MDAGLIVVAALTALLVVLLVALLRPRKHHTVIHVIGRDGADRVVAIYDPPKTPRLRRRR